MCCVISNDTKWHMCHSNDTNDTTQNDTKIFFYLFDKFSKISLLLEVSFKNLPIKLKFFFEIFAIIFLKIYIVIKNFFVLCHLCHLNDTNDTCHLCHLNDTNDTTLDSLTSTTTTTFPWLAFKLIITLISQKSASWPLITKVVLNTACLIWYVIAKLLNELSYSLHSFHE